MGWVTIFTPCWGSWKHLLMVLCGACKKRKQMSYRFVVAGSPVGRGRIPCWTL